MKRVIVKVEETNPKKSRASSKYYRNYNPQTGTIRLRCGNPDCGSRDNERFLKPLVEDLIKESKTEGTDFFPCGGQEKAIRKGHSATPCPTQYRLSITIQ